jgi:hypothetical protein
MIICLVIFKAEHIIISNKNNDKNKIRFESKIVEKFQQ